MTQKLTGTATQLAVFSPVRQPLPLLPHPLRLLLHPLQPRQMPPAEDLLVSLARTRPLATVVAPQVGVDLAMFTVAKAVNPLLDLVELMSRRLRRRLPERSLSHLLRPRRQYRQQQFRRMQAVAVSRAPHAKARLLETVAGKFELHSGREYCN